MHRDHRRYQPEAARRGPDCKEFVAELNEQGIPREEIIVAVSQVFGVSRAAARLFVLSYPAFADEQPEFDDGPWD